MGSKPDSPSPRKKSESATVADHLQPQDNGEPTSEGPDPFDPERYRTNTNYASMLVAQSHTLTCPVRKPGRETFFRTHPAHQLETWILEVGGDSVEPEAFLVEPELWPALSQLPIFYFCLLTLYQTRQGNNFLWRIKLARSGERQNDWTCSALLAVERAKNEWIRLRSNRQLGAYEIEVPATALPEPRWPTEGFNKILGTAFRNQRIVSLDHPVLKHYRGED
jgi:hypothetical protein